MIINKKKSAIIQTNKKDTKRPIIEEEISEIKIVKKYKYLGTIWRQNDRFDEQMKAVEEKARRLMIMLTPLRVKNYLRLNANLFNVFVKPNLMLVAGSLATCKKHEKNKVTILSRRLFKQWIQFPSRTPNRIINKLMGDI